MKSLTSTKKKANLLIIMIILTPIFFSSGIAQHYNQMRITLDDGKTISGKKGDLSGESVSCLVNGQLQNYDLNTVKLVAAKKGAAIKWAGGMGCCCLGLFVVSGALDPEGQLEEEGMMGAYIAGSALLTVVGAGLGYLIGSLTDPWKNVYMSNYPVVFNKIKPVMSIDYEGHPLFGLSYRF